MHLLTSCLDYCLLPANQTIVSDSLINAAFSMIGLLPSLEPSLIILIFLRIWNNQFNTVSAFLASLQQTRS